MRENILKHVDKITKQRDTYLLDSTITASLVELLHAGFVRLRHIFHRKDGLFSLTTAWNDGEHSQFLSDVPTESDFEPVEHYPGIVASFETKEIHYEVCPKTGMHSYWLPIFMKEEPYVCVEIVSEKPLSAFKKINAIGILTVYRNYLSLLDESQHDSLTGLANRKSFDRSLLRLLSSISTNAKDKDERRKKGIGVHDSWLVVIDLDHFKQVNDKFGHLFGDEVLIMVAEIMKSIFRAQDRLFRFGGDEFVVLLRHVDFDNASTILERFRKSIEQHKFPDNIGKITVSVGFARIQPIDTPVTVIGHADDAHYVAKSNGRNQVCSYEQLVREGKLKLPDNGGNFPKKTH
jgi:diguanylate cyclase (GGDEF)-like protein